MLKRFFLATLLLSGAVAVVSLPPRAGAGGKEAADNAQPSVAYNDTRQIAIAFDLVDLGRATKAPDLLISAARILKRIDAKDGDIPAEVSGGKDEPGVKTDLKKVAKDLLSEAVKLAPDNKTIADLATHAAEEKLIVPPAEAGKRGSFGGAKQYYHQPGAGVTITWRVKFVGGQDAAVSVRGNGRNNLTLRVSGNDGVNLSWQSRNPSLNWVPARNAMYTITVQNNGPGGCAYTLYHN